MEVTFIETKEQKEVLSIKTDTIPNVEEEVGISIRHDSHPSYHYQRYKVKNVYKEYRKTVMNDGSYITNTIVDIEVEEIN